MSTLTPGAPATAIELVDFGSPMPEALSNWLIAMQPHAIFGAPAWFERLCAFEKVIGNAGGKHRHFWLFILEHGLPVLAAPLEQSPGRFGKPHLRLFSNYYSPVIDLYYDRTRLSATEAWARLLAGLDGSCPGWLQFGAAPLTAVQHAAFAPVPGCTLRPHRMTANFTAAVDTPERYWANRPSQLLNTLRRKRKTLQKVEHHFEVTATPTPEQVARYWDIYLSSWKVAEPSRCFIDWLIASSAAQGRLRMGFMYVEGKVVASQMWLVADGVAHIFKLAQDRHANQHSPGSLLTEEIINAIVVPDGIHSIDFLLGGDTFKSMWMDQQAPVYGMEVINAKTNCGRLLKLAHAVKGRLRRA